MAMNGTLSKKVLVLLIGEVLEDPRVFKTCVSLCENGADVTVVCTNPSGKPARETCSGFSIIRFPHPKDFMLKRLYNWLQGRIRPEVGRRVSRIHEEVPASPIRAAVRNALLSMNFSHRLRGIRTVNQQIAAAFTRGNVSAARLHDDTSAGSFDLVHCNDVDTLAVGNTLKRAGIAREVLYDAHEFWPGIGVHGSAPNAALGKLEAAGIAEADYVVTVNPYIADMIRKEYGLADTPAVVMNCPEVYDGPVETDIVHHPVRVLYQGKVQAFRGLENLVLAFRHIGNAELTISGYGPLTERLSLLAASEGIDHKVHVTGRYDPDEALPIICRHDIGVLPFDSVTLSIMYSSPNKLFDYAMGGLAIAASNLPFLKQFIGENGAGMVFEQNDPESIASTIAAMTSDDVKLREFKRNARKAALERYHWGKQFTENYPWNSAGR